MRPRLSEPPFTIHHFTDRRGENLNIQTIFSRWIFVLLCAAGLLLPEGAWAQNVTFTDVTSAAGFDYEHGYVETITDGPEHHEERIAGGVAAADYDRDGWIDLYVTRGDIGPNLLFRNLGDGTFEEVGARVGLAIDGEKGAGPAFR